MLLHFGFMRQQVNFYAICSCSCDRLVFLLNAKNADNISFWVIFAYFFGLPVVVSLVQRVVGAFTGIQSSGGLVVSNMGSYDGIRGYGKHGQNFQWY